MEFWGVEVKPGETLTVKPELFDMIHISQASLGEFKNVKGNTNVPVRLQIDGKKFVIGFLSTEDRPQMMVDLVFEKEFQLSHDFKNGSVYFIGYTADDGTAENSDDEDEDIPSDEDVELPDDSPAKGEPQIKGGNLDSDESEDDDAAEESSDDLSDDDESEDEPEPPKKYQLMKKRAEPVALPPAKKPKLSGPQKTGGAKNGQAEKGPSPKNKGKNGKRFQKRA